MAAQEDGEPCPERTHEQLICILRQPKDLFAVINVRREPFTRPSISDSQQLDLDPYREEVRPLASAPRCKSGPLATLAQSWESLGAVSRFDAEDLHHVLNILIHTLPDSPTVADVPPLRIESTLPPPKATAAHPRAFHGTKTQPPKPRQRASIDLRPHICVPGDTNRLLVHLGRTWRHPGGPCRHPVFCCRIDCPVLLAIKAGRLMFTCRTATRLAISPCLPCRLYSAAACSSGCKGIHGASSGECWPSTGRWTWNPIPRSCGR